MRDKKKKRNPVFHVPVINYKFVEQSLKYCLIRQLNMDQCSNILSDKAMWVSFDNDNDNE